MNDPKPLYLQIYEDLHTSIRNQRYAPGDLLPSEKTICEQYKTSRPTVAKAIKMLSDAKLVHRQAGFGTQVLAPDSSGLSAGLLVPGLTETEIFTPIIASIIETAPNFELQIAQPYELNRSQDRKALALSQVEQFIKKKVNGVFFGPLEKIPDAEAFNLSIVERFTEKGIQVVLLDRDIYPWPQQAPFDMICIGNIEAGFTMANHLLENGCKQLAFVSSKNPAMTVGHRIIGTRQALLQKGFSARSLLYVEYEQDDPSTAAAQLIEANIDGIVCANDATAAVILRALLDLSVKIPEQIKVCGFDDVKYASLLSVPLTSYRQPCQVMGQLAVETMVNRIKHPERPPHHIALHGTLIVRESSQMRA
ncbi:MULTISPECIES: substrate-binding domain-containing protein [unclassified Lentimonas]|uniref:GntR family transcriptional regulator n=1 Tax=unclassified Lentimonas TaxID=2630993 RepID=UPI0013277E4A|nr:MULTISPECIES: GntR family transcriptional regulator [unclassified Lentimonas]CAA6679872.1 Ribose operon repressor [Lentimonas sp. CC4]CAA6685614.1 Ribose operon repressor [Lentimonas sp. CC6]CAA7077059.1 Ribose operon repressor [Lentimonas sp. CC4]CAA7168860.1 Ribose operon repressor [Lentimonas sp. CC21]CAA7180776.1 Ribose operon repressor [Lentimonas sp. CC8]